MRGKFEDLTGQTFGSLKVLNKSVQIPTDKQKQGVWWDCECKCGKIIQVLTKSLRNGQTTSCGCTYSNCSPECNDYEEYDETTYLFWDKNHEYSFLADKEDLSKILEHYWRSSKGYWFTFIYVEGKRTKLPLQNYLLNTDRKKIIDHKNGDQGNNKKNNLREVTYQQNAVNKKIYVQNNTGVTGVNVFSEGKWVVVISYKYKRIFLGYYTDFDKAKFARYYGEVQLYKEFTRDYETKLKYIKENKERNEDIIKTLTERIKKYYDIECKDI